jgi:hypothetical protein
MKPFIIKEKVRRRQEQVNDDNRPRLYLPIPEPTWEEAPKKEEEERGVCIIQIL